MPSSSRLSLACSIRCRRLRELVHRGQHRHQHLDIAVVRGAQDGAQLLVEHLRLGEAQPDGAQPQRGVRREALGPVELLVGAQIEGADGDGQVRPSPRDPAVGLELLVLGGQLRRGSGTGTRCGTARCPLPNCPWPRPRPREARCSHAARCGVPSSVAAARGLQALELFALEQPLLLPQPVFGQNVCLIRVDDHHAAGAVHDQQLVLVDQLARVVRAPRCEGMSKLRARIAVCEVAPPKSVMKLAKWCCLNRMHVRGRQVVGHQDAVFLRMAAARGSRAADR